MRLIFQLFMMILIPTRSFWSYGTKFLNEDCAAVLFVFSITYLNLDAFHVCRSIIAHSVVGLVLAERQCDAVDARYARRRGLQSLSS